MPVLHKPTLFLVHTVKEKVSECKCQVLPKSQIPWRLEKGRQMWKEKNDSVVLLLVSHHVLEELFVLDSRVLHCTFFFPPLLSLSGSRRSFGLVEEEDSFAAFRPELATPELTTPDLGPLNLVLFDLGPLDLSFFGDFDFSF